MILSGELASEYGYWEDHPRYPVRDWLHEVNDNNTREGYWQWVASSMDVDADEN